MFKQIAIGSIMLISTAGICGAEQLALTTGDTTADQTINGNTGIDITLSNGVQGDIDLIPLIATATAGAVTTGHNQGTRVYQMHSNGGPLYATSKLSTDTLTLTAADATNFPTGGATTAEALTDSEP